MSKSDVTPSSMGSSKRPSDAQAAWNDGLHFLMQQCRKDSQRWFPKTKDDLAFMTLAMAGEVGEVANLVKKNVRGSLSEEDMMQELPEEVVDALIYLYNLMSLPVFKDVDWMSIWYKKRQYNEERFGTTCIKPDDKARETFEKEHFGE